MHAVQLAMHTPWATYQYLINGVGICGGRQRRFEYIYREDAGQCSTGQRKRGQSMSMVPQREAL